MDPDELSLGQISMPAHQNPCRPNLLDILQTGNLQEPNKIIVKNGKLNENGDNV